MATNYTTRTIPTTNYTTRTTVSTSYTGRVSINRHAGYLCDRLWNRICDRLWNPIIVYDVNGSIDLGWTVYVWRTLI